MMWNMETVFSELSGGKAFFSVKPNLLQKINSMTLSFYAPLQPLILKSTFLQAKYISMHPGI